jgi:hypothetical protein
MSPTPRSADVAHTRSRTALGQSDKVFECSTYWGPTDCRLRAAKLAARMTSLLLRGDLELKKLGRSGVYSLTDGNSPMTAAWRQAVRAYFIAFLDVGASAEHPRLQ